MQASYLYLIAYKAEMWNGGYEKMSSKIDSLIMRYINNDFTTEDIEMLSKNLRSKLWKEEYEKLWKNHFSEGNLKVTVLLITKLKDETK